MCLFFQRIKSQISSDRFLTNSFIFFVGSFLANLGNYLFHFVMARMLSVESYGELQSLIALSVVFGIPIASLSTVLIKYTAHFRAREQLNKVYTLFLFFTKKVLMVAAGFLLMFFILNQPIAGFLNLSSSLSVIILGMVFLPTFLGSVSGGIIQGLEKFKAASIISIIAVSFKVLLAVLLVKAGFGVNGAIGAIVLAGLIGYFLAFLPLKFLFNREKEQIDTKEISQYFFSVFFTILFLNLLYNIDIILIKHFLPSYEAGQYSALALMGHIIFFLGGPIVGVMFPMSAAAYANDRDPAQILKKTLVLTVLLGAGTLVFYFLFPGFVIRILVGSKFLSLSKFLGWFGISMLFFALVNLLSQYFLSIHKTKCAFILGIGVLLQVILISYWHNNLWQIIWIMNGVIATVLTLLVIYYRGIKDKYALNLTVTRLQ